MLLDPTVLTMFLALVALAALIGVTTLAVALVGGLTRTRRSRLALRESIPTYYGRLHFAR